MKIKFQITILISFMMSPLSVHGASAFKGIARSTLNTVKKIGPSNDRAIGRAILEELRGKIRGGRKQPLVSSRGYLSIGALDEEDLVEYLWNMKEVKYTENPSIIAVKPLSEIYSKHPIGRPIEEILQVANREDRTLVAVFDTGVNYNHPDLAYKISRPLQNNIEEIGPEKIRDSIELYKNRREIKKYIDHYRNSGDSRKADLLESSLSEAEKVVHKTTIGWDFELNDSLPFDTFDPINFFSLKSDGHGTYVASVVSSTLHGTDDIAILPIASRMRRLDGETFKEMVDFAHKRGARIINFSYGLECPDCTWDPRAMKDFLESGFFSVYKTMEKYSDILFVVAAGNKGVNLDTANPYFPASFSNLPNLVTVAAVDASNVLHFDYGLKSVHIAAHGIKVKAITNKGEQAYLSGTSIAAPQVSRVAAQIKHINPNLSPTEIISIIRETATKVDHLADKVSFGGVLNEEAAIERAKSL